MTLFFFIVILFILGENYYVFFRLWNILPVGKTLLVVVAVVLLLCFFVGMFGGSLLPKSIVSVVYHVGMAWFFIALYLMFIFLFLDILRLVLPMQRVMVDNWLTFGALTIVMTAVFVYGYFNYLNTRRVEINIEIAKPVSPLKIVGLSDLHLGYGIGKTELEKWITLINREKPDIVLISGDIIDHFTKSLDGHNLSFEKIKSRDGVYACLGNHEYIGTPSKISQSLDFLHAAKVTVLRDTAVLINNEFYLIGRDDRFNLKRKSIHELLQTIDATKPLILLDHQPFYLEETAKNGIDLQFSGHTHHGQILPVNWIAKRIYEVSHGYLKKNNSHIYVSSGIGIWGGKFRIGTQSEYIVFNLKQQKNNN
ncbi:MAG: metallophosphoesterase [Bacteroidales bacterium]|jgi:predicted MPP superfamily phosphohydrolase|nr:metallophosphoesterase [Bacteroidales bacterium]